jgi:hypothetical protein
MESALKMPATYAVIDREEMTYIDGGDYYDDAASAEAAAAIYLTTFYVGCLAVAGLRLVSYVQGVAASREWYKNYVAEHPDSTFSERFDAGMNALTADISQGPWNAIRDVYRAFNVITDPLLSALIILI